MFRIATENKMVRLLVAGLCLIAAFGVFQVEEAQAGNGPCWFCISYDLCEQSNFGSQGCTVGSGGHGCLPQCMETGGPCFNF